MLFSTSISKKGAIGHQETRERILQQAAALFNQQGYSGSSIADIMRVTGLQKGGRENGAG